MKTDKFDDAIRRKLESIEPPFRERDWSHMQAFMHRHGYPPTWAGATQWLVPLAAAAAVTGLIISTIWQFRTNQELNKSLQTLSQTIVRLETTQEKLIKGQTRTDTVYVTNFTKTPVPGNGTSTSGQSAPNESSIRSRDNYALQPGKLPVHPRDKYAQQPSNPGVDERGSTNGAGTQPIASPEKQPGSAPSATATRQLQRLAESRQRSDDQLATDVTRADKPMEAQPRVVEPDTREKTRRSDRLTARPNESVNPTNIPSQTEHLNQRGASGTNSSASRTLADRTTTYPADAKAGEAREVEQRAESASFLPNAQTISRPETIALLTSRPMAVDSAYYVESLAKRTRRLRSLWPAPAPVMPAAMAPSDVASSRPNLGGIHLRLGISGETGTERRTAGVYSEALVGKHWSVGIGLNRISLQGGRFPNDDQFKRKTTKDFPRLYGPGFGKIHDVVNIDRQFVIWQLPVNLSYRARLGKGFTLIPSAGLDFNLAAKETITFTYRLGPYERYVPGELPARSCDWYTAYTIALGVEKSWKRLAFQAGPVLASPIKAGPDPINSAALSFRARILFQL